MYPKLLSLLISFILIASVTALPHTITVKGEPRTPDNKIDLMYEAGVFGEQGKMTADVNIDNYNGFFEIKDYAFDDAVIVNGDSMVNSVNIGVMGSCFYHTFNIKYQDDQYEVFDANTQNMITTSKNDVIDLGILKEDKSNYIMVDSDVPVTFEAFDMFGQQVALNGAYRKNTGMSDSFASSSTYRLVLTSEKGKTWEKTVTTGAYCESTRLIKRKNLFIEEHFQDNSFPKIGLFQNIVLFFKSLFS